MNSSLLRFIFFISFFTLFSLIEALLPRKQRLYKRIYRWPGNFSILISGTIAAGFIPFLLPAAAAVDAAEKGFGLFNVVSMPRALSFLLTLLILDIVIYFQHRIFHIVPFLWRIHRMHHMDKDLDASSALRFHPFEIIISIVIKTASVWLLGASLGAVFVFEILLNSAAMFNHANIYIPLSADSIIRKIIVTPDMHRIHHSVHRKETDSNFGFSLSWWDFIFKSYTDNPKDGQDNMKIGLKGFDSRKIQQFYWMLLSPFLNRNNIQTEK